MYPTDNFSNIGDIPLLYSTVCLDINDVANPVQISIPSISVGSGAITYLYCLKYVDSLIIPFFLKSREKAY